MFRFLILIVTFILSACNNTEGELKKLAISTISEQLKDPDSAKFSDVFLPRGVEGSVSVCGYVNAKNSYGAYEGKMRFLVSIDEEKGRYAVSLSKLDAPGHKPSNDPDLKNRTVFDIAWFIFCEKPVKSDS